MFVCAMGCTWSGDIVGGVACGTESSKSSARSNVEKVRLASSAMATVSLLIFTLWLEGLALLEMKFAMRSSFFLFGRRGGRGIVM
jgi:hypothetical protein